MHSLILRGDRLVAADLAEFTRIVAGSVAKAVALPEGPPAWRLEHVNLAAQSAAAAAAAALQCDYGFVPSTRRLSDFRVAAFDMDSTLITIECIDEIADYAGVKTEVAAITAAAMRGEITDYVESLRRRVALLEGLPESVLGDVYRDRLQLTHGAAALTSGLKGASIRLLLVSGGFTFFTDRLARQLGFDAVASNLLEVVGGKLTGRLVGRVVDASVKAQELVNLCARQACRAKSSAIAVGDGANDLEMMREAAVSVAHHAKPKVQAQASYAINHTGLDTVLALLGQPPPR